MVTLVTLAINIGVLLWGAARVSATVDTLKDTVTPLVVQTNQNTTDITVLKAIILDREKEKHRE